MHFSPELSSPVIKSEDKKEMMNLSNSNGKWSCSINSSSLGLLLECGRKSHYILGRGLKKVAPNPATTFGSAIHAALEHFYRSKRSERQIPGNFKTKMEELEFDLEPKENLLLQCGQKFVEAMADMRSVDAFDKRSIASGLWNLYHYFQTYIDDPYEVMEDEDGPLTERRIEYTLYDSSDLEIKYFGSIDVILRHAVTGAILVADHKTSSVVGTTFYNRLKPNHQYTGYVLGAREALGLDTQSFLVNCIQVKPKPKTERGTPPNFPRQVTTRDESDFEEFKLTVVAAVRQYIRWQEDGFFPLGNVNACGMYNGCQFLEVCNVSNNDIRESVIKAHFEENGYA